MPFYKARPVVPKRQPDKYLYQTDPVSDQLYPVLDATDNVRVIAAYAVATWSVQPTQLGVRLTVDGVLETYIKGNPENNVDYLIEPAMRTLKTYAEVGGRSFALEGRRVKVEARVTGGTVSLLQATVVWAKW